ncbi:MAG: sigma 54-interacting transcriptional regulator [Bryobacteraceae bacterium]|nr:sigma 54-interacting transcriptional regulator [Bryobacteraceae bacterium]
MLIDVQHSQAEIYQALFELSQSIADHSDLESLCEGLAKSLKRIVEFERFALMLYDPEANVMHVHGIGENHPASREVDLTLPLERTPAGWVLTNQQPLVIPNLERETRWPKFVGVLCAKRVVSLTLVPLTTGSRRLGVLGFGSNADYTVSATELAFMERTASEFAVSVESYLTRQKLVHERDRLRALFEITNALVSKLSPAELFPAISEQMGRVIAHDAAGVTLLNRKTGQIELYALHFSGNARMPVERTSGSPKGLPMGEALATGKPVVLSEPDFQRFSSPLYQNLLKQGVAAHCSIPLSTPNGIIGTLELGRHGGRPFTEEEVELGVQVARQIAVAVENSLAFQELDALKDKLASEKLYLEDEIRSDQNLGNMVGDSPAFQALLKSVQIVAPTDATVLILGETGTGKELIARAIHDLSDRGKQNFVKVNCAAIPAGLLESELFGHEKGAFTSAAAQKIGRFELADRGTLFLDEIGEIPLELQSKLLRAIQEQEFERLGGNRTFKVDVRFVAATNRDLKRMMEENLFRGDLYYRLHVFPVQMPPLRERREDIPLLVRYFVQKYAQRMNRVIDAVPTGLMDALVHYDWPGNIRELQNVLERSVILSPGPTLRIAMPEMGEAVSPAPRRSYDVEFRDHERERILQALKDSGGVVGGADGAAARLGMHRTTLQSRMKKLNIGRQYA